MTFLPDDALAVCTRRGEVWKISNPYMKNGSFPKYKLFAQGLHEALGLNYIDGELYVTQRSELTRLRDVDGDGEPPHPSDSRYGDDRSRFHDRSRRRRSTCVDSYALIIEQSWFRWPQRQHHPRSGLTELRSYSSSAPKP